MPKFSAEPNRDSHFVMASQLFHRFSLMFIIPSIVNPKLQSYFAFSFSLFPCVFSYTMTASQLQTLSPEILTCIFQQCASMSQLVSLASTCKYVHLVWLANSSSIIWDTISPHILCFDEALVAVGLLSTLFLLRLS